MRILFLADWYPYPIDNGSKLRIYGLLRGLARRHEVTLISFVDGAPITTISPEMRALCREVRLVPGKAYSTTGFRALSGLFSPTPRYISDTFSPEMAGCIQETLADQEFDLVIASQLGTARYQSYFRSLPGLFEEVEVGSFYEQFKAESSLLRRLRNGLTWIKHRRYVAGLLREFQVCTVVSEQEKRLLAQIAPEFHSVEVIPNFIDLADYQGVKAIPEPNSLIFTGPFRYLANHDAMVWFLSEVYPLIQAQVPDVRLTITGDHADLPLPPASNVKLTGFVDDVRSLIASAWISLAPLRVGGGTRLKILEAMALGVPVVSTSIGAQGLEFTADQHLLIGDSAEAFAGQVIRLLKDASLRQEISARARQQAAVKYDWHTVMPRFERLVQKAAYNLSAHDIL